MASTVTVKGQVTIPKAVRDRLGVQPGDRVEFHVEAGQRAVLTRAVDSSFESRFAKLIGCADAGLTTDEIMAMTRGDDQA